MIFWSLISQPSGFLQKKGDTFPSGIAWTIKQHKNKCDHLSRLSEIFVWKWNFEKMSFWPKTAVNVASRSVYEKCNLWFQFFWANENMKNGNFCDFNSSEARKFGYHFRFLYSLRKGKLKNRKIKTNPCMKVQFHFSNFVRK